MLQAGIIKASAKTGNNGVEELEKRINELEAKLASGNFKVSTSSSQTANVVPSNSLNSAPSAPQPKVQDDVPDPRINQDGETIGSWNRIVDILKRSGKMVLSTCFLSTKAKQVGDMIVEVYFLNGITDFNRKLLEDASNKNAIDQAVVKIFGKDMHLKYIDAKGASGSNFKDAAPETNDKKDSTSAGFNPMGDLGIDINIFE